MKETQHLSFLKETAVCWTTQSLAKSVTKIGTNRIEYKPWHDGAVCSEAAAHEKQQWQQWQQQKLWGLDQVRRLIV